MFVRNRYAAMLNNAVVYEVLRTADSTAYKIQYQVGDKLVSLDTVFNQKQTSSRRLLQAANPYVDIANYAADANFVAADKMVKKERAEDLSNSQIVRAEKQDNTDSFNYRITYQTAAGSF